MAIVFSARTDVGRVREQNEDNFLVDRKLQLYVVCDGMGGHLSGEVASATAVNVVRETLLANRGVLDDFRNGASGVSETDVQDLLTQAVQTASFRIYERGRLNPEQRGMGTTLSLLILLGEHGFLAHVGDSRVYRRRDDEVEQLTSDHSLYNAMVQSGAAVEAAGLAGRLKNAVTRAVGVQESVEVDTVALELRPSDRFLLCSDGLSGYFEDGDLVRLMRTEDSACAVDEMIRHANARGGRDNITAVVVDIPGAAPGETSPGDLARLLRGTPMADGLSPAELRALEVYLVDRVYPPGDTVAEPGDDSAVLQIVVEGHVEAATEDGLVRRLRRGDPVGGPLWLTGERHRSRLRAAGEGPARLIGLAREDLDRLQRENPQAAAAVARNIAVMLSRHLMLATEALHDPLYLYAVPNGQSPGVGTTAPITRQAPRTLDLDPAEIIEAHPGEALPPGPPPIPGGPPDPASDAVSAALTDALAAAAEDLDDEHDADIDVAVADTLPYYKVDATLAQGSDVQVEELEVPALPVEPEESSEPPA